MKPKFKVGDRVRVKHRHIIDSELEQGMYPDTACIMDSMIFGKSSIIIKIGKSSGAEWYNRDEYDSDYKSFNYQLKDCPMNWWYGEDTLIGELQKKINKILKL